MKRTLKEEIVLNESEKTIKVLYSSTFKLIGLGFKKGQFLEKHSTPTPAVLIIHSGSIEFKMNDQVTQLNAGDYFEIPAKVEHEVKANEDSLLYLVK